jgi:REP element-mobilizing transposase RayT
MARQLRTLLPDGTYHVMGRGTGPSPIFGEDDDRTRFLRLLERVTRRCDWSFHALCLMETHYHLVFTSTREQLSRGMHALNGLYARRFNEKYGRWGHLFGDRFACRVVKDDRYLATLCRYVVLNPVRVGLCERAQDWPWSYSRYGLEATASD